MKTILLALVGLITASGVFAQGTSISTDELKIRGNAPAMVSSASATIVGATGRTNYYYWIIATYPVGKSFPTGPISAFNAPDSLTVSNYVRLNWNAMSGAVSYDVLRTSTPSAPNGSCTCAVITGTTANTVNDQGAALTAYTVTSQGGATTRMSVNNLSLASPMLTVEGTGWDMSGATATRPNKTGTGAPTGSCISGSTYQRLDIGELYLCVGGVWGGITPWLVVTNYAFNYTNGGNNVFGDLSVAGANSLTMVPCPLGVAGNNTNHYLRISGGVGTAETVLISGGTCTSGATTGTITFTTANAHTSTWSISTATAGAQEAIWSQPTGSVITLLFPADVGGFTWYAPVRTNNRSVTFQGQGWNASGSGSLIGLATAGQIGIYQDDSVMRVEGLRFVGDGSTTAIYTLFTAANGGQTAIIDNWFEAHATSVNIRTASDTYIERNLFRPSTVCLEVGNELWGDQGGLYIRDNYFGCTSKNIYMHEIGGSYIQNNSFLGATDGIYVDFRMVKVNTNGTTVTATTGYTFGTGLTTGVGVWINGANYAIASRDSATQITLTGSAGVQNDVDFGIGAAQLQIQNNNFDNVASSSINLAGSVKFGAIQITSNHFNRVSDVVAYNAVWMTNENLFEVSVVGNTVFNSVGSANTTTGVRATATGYMFTAKSNTFSGVTNGVHLTLDGTNDFGLHINDNTFDGLTLTNNTAIYISKAIYANIGSNQISRYNIGVQIDSTSNLVRITDTNMNCTGATAIPIDIVGGTANISISGVSAQIPCNYFVRVGAGVTADAVRVEGLNGTISTGVVSFAVAAKLVEDRGLNFGDLPTNISNGSMIYCTDCRISYDGVCTNGGAGAIATRLNAEWNCNLAYGNLNPTKPACNSAASPAVCGTATTGSVVIAAGATSVVVNTARVTGDSQVLVLFDSSLGTRLGVTCNTTYAAPFVTARSSGVSFTISVAGAPAVNPACYSFLVLN